MKNKSSKGFTLVELIVVIGVLALLAVGAIVAVGNVQRTARRSNRRVAATDLARNLELFNEAAISNGGGTISSVGLLAGFGKQITMSSGTYGGGDTIEPSTGAGVQPRIGYRRLDNGNVVYMLIAADGNVYETIVQNVPDANRIIGNGSAASMSSAGVDGNKGGFLMFYSDTMGTGIWRVNENNIMNNDLSP